MGTANRTCSASCYRRSLEEADAIGAGTVAFPAISTGIYGYPVDDAAEIAVTTVTACPTQVATVSLVAFDSTAALRRVTGGLIGTAQPR